MDLTLCKVGQRVLTKDGDCLRYYTYNRLSKYPYQFLEIQPGMTIDNVDYVNFYLKTYTEEGSWDYGYSPHNIVEILPYTVHDEEWAVALWVQEISNRVVLT